MPLPLAALALVERERLERRRRRPGSVRTTAIAPTEARALGPPPRSRARPSPSPAPIGRLPVRPRSVRPTRAPGRRRAGPRRTRPRRPASTRAPRTLGPGRGPGTGRRELRGTPLDGQPVEEEGLEELQTRGGSGRRRTPRPRFPAVDAQGRGELQAGRGPRRARTTPPSVASGRLERSASSAALDPVEPQREAPCARARGSPRRRPSSAPGTPTRAARGIRRGPAEALGAPSECSAAPSMPRLSRKPSTTSRPRSTPNPFILPRPSSCPGMRRRIDARRGDACRQSLDISRPIDRRYRPMCPGTRTRRTPAPRAAPPSWRGPSPTSSPTSPRRATTPSAISGACPGLRGQGPRRPRPAAARRRRARGLAPRHRDHRRRGPRPAHGRGPARRGRSTCSSTRSARAPRSALGFRELARYGRLTQRPRRGAPRHRGRHPRRDPRPRGVSSPMLRQRAEFSLALALRLAREATGTPLVPRRVHFAHRPARDDLFEHRALLPRAAPLRAGGQPAR